MNFFLAGFFDSKLQNCFHQAWGDLERGTGQR
jgi:hypothetical protein